MNPERDTTRIVRSWLESGVTDLPDRVLDPVLDQLPATPQRGHPWQARRFTMMTSTVKIAVAAAAVVVVGVVGFTRLPGATQPGVDAAPTPEPAAAAAPSQVPSTSPIPFLPTSGVLEPGRYRIKNLTIEVPSGWHSLGSDLLSKDYGRGTEPGALFAVWPIAGTFVDPCTDHTLVQPGPGPGVDALAEALANQPGTEAGPPTAVTVDGYPGKMVESTVTADIEPCGIDGFLLWAGPDIAPRYVQGNDEMNRMYIVDVDGERLTFNGRFPAVTTAADRAELEAIIDSIDIDSSAQPGVGAAPTPTPTATAAPTHSPSASPIPLLPTSGVLEPGRYRLVNRTMSDMSLSIEVPAGWTREDSDMIAKNRGFLDSEAGALFAFWPISGTFLDPCTDHTLVQPSPGPGIDALADALANQPGTEAGPPTAVTVDGYPGKMVESTVTADIEPCGKNGFWLWAMPDYERRYVQGNDEMNRMYIVDVDGERLTFNGRFPAVTTAADRAELEAIIDSIQIEPLAP